MENLSLSMARSNGRLRAGIALVLPLAGLLVAASAAQAQQVYYPVAAAVPAQTVPAATYATVAPGTTYVTAPTTATYGSYYYPAATAAAAPAYATGGDAYGFTSWLNGVRSQYGLPAVSFDSSLASWAASNNAQQAARGLGHFVMGPSRRQNSAVGTAASIGYQWMQSPAHRALLLDPTIRFIGLAGNGQYWTLNAR